MQIKERKVDKREKLPNHLSQSANATTTIYFLSFNSSAATTSSVVDDGWGCARTWGLIGTWLQTGHALAHKKVIKGAVTASVERSSRCSADAPPRRRVFSRSKMLHLFLMRESVCCVENFSETKVPHSYFKVKYSAWEKYIVLFWKLTGFTVFFMLTSCSPVLSYWEWRMSVASRVKEYNLASQNL